MRVGLALLAGILLANCSHAGDTTMPAGAAVQHVRPAANGYAPLYSFRYAPDGAVPSAGLVSVSGTLYGTTDEGGADDVGTVFSLTRTDKESITYSFKQGEYAGTYPHAQLFVVGSEMYGTAPYGGANNLGAVFKIGLVGGARTVYSFGGGDGSNPYASLVRAGNDFYGTALNGGHNEHGSVFELSGIGAETTIYSFGDNSRGDGSGPNANLVAVKGVFYGTTQYGGSSGDGTVFAVSRSGEERVVHSFGGGSDGSGPRYAGLVSIGNTFYGTTCAGGTHGDGTVFMVTASGTERVLYNFGDTNDDGSCPSAGLVTVRGGLYGTALEGGIDGYGTIFEVTLLGKERILHSFEGEPDGANPLGTLLDSGGMLYGTTTVGGNGYGTIYRISP
jgi:uncharacterized repeat protein (TIGR03803 family)